MNNTSIKRVALTETELQTVTGGLDVDELELAGTAIAVGAMFLSGPVGWVAAGLAITLEVVGAARAING